MVRCSVCARQNQEDSRFCSACGNALPTALSGSRKTVTVLFVDITDSTRLAESIDSEPLQQVMERFFDLAREAIYAHGGSVEKFIGDAVFAVFGTPVLHEDDSLRAVRTALEIRARLRELNLDLHRG